MGGGGGGGHDPFDIFESFFGGGGRGGGRRGPRKTEDVAHALKLKLEDFYCGCSKKMALGRNKVCTKCSGTGSKSGQSVTCQDCRVRRPLPPHPPPAAPEPPPSPPA